MTKSDEYKRELVASKRLPIQCLFNILSVVFIILISLGLWTSFLEIKRLSESTKLLEKSLQELAQRFSDDNTESDSSKDIHSKLVFEKLTPDSQYDKSTFQIRNIFKRSVSSPKTYDPLSSKPEVRKF